MNATSNLLATQLTSSALVVYLIQLAKNTSWIKLIQPESKKLLQILSAVGALIGTFGVNYAWNPQARTITFAIPTFGAFLLLFWHWLNHVAMQEIIYQATKKGAKQ